MTSAASNMRYEHVDMNELQMQPTAIPTHRNSLSYRAQFRTDRIFTVGHEWYFSTREGINFGPYQNKQLANKALDTFLSVVS